MLLAGAFCYKDQDAKDRSLRQKVLLLAQAMSHRSKKTFCLEDKNVCFVFGHEAEGSSDLLVAYSGQFTNLEELRKDLFLPENVSPEAGCAAAYKKWGPDFIGHMDGEFTVALFDKSAKRLFLARDRVGMKPLYYYCDDAAIFFASEVNALWRIKEKRCLNYAALHSAIIFSSVCSREHLFKDVYELRAGHYCLLSPDLKTPVLIPYWDREFNIIDRAQDFYEKEFKRLLDESVKKRLPVSGEKVGISSSGGIDSTLVLAHVKKFYRGPVATYTAIAQGDKTSEYQDARLVAKHFHTEHHEIRITAKEALETVPRIIWHMGEFTFRHVYTGICLQTYFVAKKARETGCGYIFTGNGVEHNFDGNGPQRKLYEIASHSRQAPSFIRDRILPHLIPQGMIKEALELRRFYLWSTEEEKAIEEKYILFNSGWRKETTLRRRYTQETNDRLGDTQAKSILSDYLKKCNARDYFNKLLYIDFKTWNSRRNLIANERLFGAFGIVSHIPFLDVDLIEFSSSWPIAMKHSFKDSKYCIRKYFRDEKFLPRAVFDKGKKDSLLRFPYWQNDTLDAILHFADRLRTRRLFNENFIDKVLSRAKNRPDRAYQYLVFGFFVLELWLRIFVDRSEIAERDLTLDHLAQDAP